MGKLKQENFIPVKKIDTFTIAMITDVEKLTVDIPQTELREYQQQRDDFMVISKLCAGTVHYENSVKSIQSLLPSETKIREFNEKERLRLNE